MNRNHSSMMSVPPPSDKTVSYDAGLSSKELFEASVMVVGLFVIKSLVMNFVGYILATGLVLKLWPLPVLTAAWYASSSPERHVSYTPSPSKIPGKWTQSNSYSADYTDESINSPSEVKFVYRWPYEEQPNMWMYSSRKEYVVTDLGGPQPTDQWIPKEPPIELIRYWKSQRDV